MCVYVLGFSLSHSLYVAITSSLFLVCGYELFGILSRIYIITKNEKNYNVFTLTIPKNPFRIYILCVSDWDERFGQQALAQTLQTVVLNKRNVNHCSCRVEAFFFYFSFPPFFGPWPDVSTGTSIVFFWSDDQNHTWIHWGFQMCICFSFIKILSKHSTTNNRN